MKTLSRTRQRTVILEELRKLKSHPSAEDLYSLVRERLPNISLGTVYRNLNLMAEQGKILRLASGASQRRFDGETAPHFHCRCPRCDRVDDLDLSGDLKSADDCLRAGVEARPEFLGYAVEFLSVCGNCAVAAAV